MSTDTASLYSVTSTSPLTAAGADYARRNSKPRTLFARMFKSDRTSRPAPTPEETFREIMSINASSGAPEVKAFMYESKPEKRAVAVAAATAKKAKKTKAPPKTSQEIADEIMHLNAVHGHPSIQGYLAGMK
ncbi:hypothetical protein JCM3774_004527 [Rhodotorula dairenensis]